MAKQKKRREADFTTKEMADLSNCKSEQTFMNRLNSVCEHYGIDPMLFKMDETINSSENFFPAECGELLALLVKYYKDNPAVNENKDLKGVTAQNICTFYKEMMEDIDKLPDEIKNMVYALPSHFTSNRITIWIERLIPIMTQFILSYVDEQGEDMGALLQRLCVDIDKANYNLFWNYKFISMAQQANEEETEKYEQFMDLIYGDRDDRKVELEKRINAMNISIDVAIADLIKRLMLDVSKERILDASKRRTLDSQTFYDNKIERNEYYSYLDTYTNPGDIHFKKETLNHYTRGARTWKTIEEKIREENYIPEDVHLTYESELRAKESYIMELKKNLEEAESDLERFKKLGDDYKKSRDQSSEEFVRNLNSEYLVKCERVRKDEKQLADWTDKYISQVIWEFLNKK